MVLNGEGCVAMATALDENSLLSYWGVEGRTINCHLQSRAVWTIDLRQHCVLWRGMRCHGNGIGWDLRFHVELLRAGPLTVIWILVQFGTFSIELRQHRVLRRGICCHGNGIRWDLRFGVELLSRRAVESWTSDIKVKTGGRWERVHWIYSDTVFYGEGCVAMVTPY